MREDRAMRHRRDELRPGLLMVAAAACLASLWVIVHGTAVAQTKAESTACPGDNGGITLPKGFCATVFADHIGHARHLAVAANGTVYVNTWSGVYYNDDDPPPGGFLVALKDTKGTGTADMIARFGSTAAEGDHGGTGIALYKGRVYAETNDKIVRYDLRHGEMAPEGRPKTVLSGLPLTGDHPMHPFVIDKAGRLFVDLGSATNACQDKNRLPQSLGHQPCTELETRGGTWAYDANALDQSFSSRERYVTGLRNGEGLAFDASGQLFATQHGRDQLFENWPQDYTQPQGADLPAEELVAERPGADFGWPYCYFDGISSSRRLVLAPEYGGDGGHEIGVCAQKTPPVASFPAHWAPNDLAIYAGHTFPKVYNGAAFIAFHGSWNRAPAPQGGYNVVVQPMADGKARGGFHVFADGFAGPDKTPGQATHRPTGLAVGPDGALYIADDIKGTIWRVTYAAAGAAGLDQGIEAAAPAATSGATVVDAQPPEGIHPDAGAPDRRIAEPASPAGTTPQEVALGAKIFDGAAAGGTCAGCHGDNAKGTPIGPSLVKDHWLWGDGSLAALAHTITNGVAQPKQHPGAMPPMGGAPLSAADVRAVAAYVYALNHPS